MSDTLVRDILASGSAMLKDIAEAAKTTGEHVYGVLVRQSFAEGLSAIIVAAMIVVTMAILIRTSIPWAIKKDKEMKTVGADYTFGVCVALIFALFFLFVLAIVITPAIQKIINPEYFAIKFLIDSVTNK